MEKYFTTDILNKYGRLEFVINDVVKKFDEDGFHSYSSKLCKRLDSTLEGRCLRELMQAVGKFRDSIKDSTEQELLTLKHKNTGTY